MRGGRRNTIGRLTKALLSAAVSVLLAVLYYLLFSLFFTTDVERELEARCAAYDEILPGLEEDVAMLEREVEYLGDLDRDIYRNVFKAEAPALADLYSPDAQSAGRNGRKTDLWKYCVQGMDRLLLRSDRIEKNFLRVQEVMDSARRGIPLMMPVEDVAPSHVGASVGDRMNPFYKTSVMHTGLDMVAPQGTPVRATASGYVSAVRRSQGGSGNMVEITHDASRYVTRYAHLDYIMTARGRRVKAGDVIGTVGASGRAFTTHLHYEVLHGGEVMDPLQYMWADLTPRLYMDMLTVSASSGQSMD